jgi:hypothetical protein
VGHLSGAESADCECFLVSLLLGPWLLEESPLTSSGSVDVLTIECMNECRNVWMNE